MNIEVILNQSDKLLSDSESNMIFIVSQSVFKDAVHMSKVPEDANNVL